jgi:hypothetical protein
VIKVLTGKLELESVDDGGQARICRLDGEDGLFVRVQSWDESAEDEIGEDANRGHEEIRRFENKKVRITIEVLE